MWQARLWSAVPLQAGRGRGCLARFWGLLGLLWSIIPGRARGHAGRGILCSFFCSGCLAWCVASVRGRVIAGKVGQPGDRREEPAALRLVVSPRGCDACLCARRLGAVDVQLARRGTPLVLAGGRPGGSEPVHAFFPLLLGLGGHIPEIGEGGVAPAAHLGDGVRRSRIGEEVLLP